MNRFKALLLPLSAVLLNTVLAAQVPESPRTKPAPTATPAASTHEIPKSWEKVPIPTLHKFKPQEPRRIELPNGMVIFLQENHELPLIEGDIRIRGGSRDEPADKVGLVALYADVWRTGGTKAKTG